MKDPIHRRTWAIVIHGHRWNVFVMSDQQIHEEWKKDNAELSAKIQSVNGFCDRDVYRIVVNEKLYGKSGFMETLCHEITHAILNDLTQMEEYNEELVAETMGREMMNVFRQFKTLPKGWAV